MEVNNQEEVIVFYEVIYRNTANGISKRELNLRILRIVFLK